jgi:hypothetical protein
MVLGLKEKDQRQSSIHTYVIVLVVVEFYLLLEMVLGVIAPFDRYSMTFPWIYAIFTIMWTLKLKHPIFSVDCMIKILSFLKMVHIDTLRITKTRSLTCVAKFVIESKKPNKKPNF